MTIIVKASRFLPWLSDFTSGYQIMYKACWYKQYNCVWYHDCMICKICCFLPLALRLHQRVPDHVQGVLELPNIRRSGAPSARHSMTLPSIRSWSWTVSILGTSSSEPGFQFFQFYFLFFFFFFFFSFNFCFFLILLICILRWMLNDKAQSIVVC